MRTFEGHSLRMVSGTCSKLNPREKRRVRAVSPRHGRVSPRPCPSESVAGKCEAVGVKTGTFTFTFTLSCRLGKTHDHRFLDRDVGSEERRSGVLGVENH